MRWTAAVRTRVNGEGRETKVAVMAMDKVGSSDVAVFNKPSIGATVVVAGDLPIATLDVSTSMEGHVVAGTDMVDRTASVVVAVAIKVVASAAIFMLRPEMVHRRCRMCLTRLQCLQGRTRFRCPGCPMLWLSRRQTR